MKYATASSSSPARSAACHKLSQLPVELIQIVDWNDSVIFRAQSPKKVKQQVSNATRPNDRHDNPALTLGNRYFIERAKSPIDNHQDIRAADEDYIAALESHAGIDQNTS
jgi:hypothetical protein